MTAHLDDTLVNAVSAATLDGTPLIPTRRTRRRDVSTDE
jgi:hypothetical protein